MEQCRQGKLAKWIHNLGKMIDSKGWAWDWARMARAFLLYTTGATPFANGGSIYVPKSNFVLNPLFELATIASRIPVHHY